MKKSCIHASLFLLICFASAMPLAAGTYGKVNLARNKPVTPYTNTIWGAPEWIVDGVHTKVLTPYPYPAWMSYQGGAQNSCTITVDLGAQYRIGKVNIEPSQIMYYAVFASPDNQSWVPLGGNGAAMSHHYPVTIAVDGAVTARYIMFHAIAYWNMYVGLREVEVFEWLPNEDPPPPSAYGVQNLARQAQLVPADPPRAGSPISYLNDGDQATTWYTNPPDYYLWEFDYHYMAGSVRIDLGREYDIGKIAVFPTRAAGWSIYGGTTEEKPDQPFWISYPELFGAVTQPPPGTISFNGEMRARYIWLDPFMASRSTAIDPGIAEIEIYEWKGLPQLELTPNNVTFGEQVVSTTSAAKNLTLTNRSNLTVFFSSIAASESFDQTNDCGNSLIAGGSCGISVRFLPTIDGAKIGTLSVTGSNSSAPTVAALGGIGIVPAASLAPASLTYPDQATGTTSPAQTVTLTNTGSGSLTITSIAAPADFLQTNNCPAALTANSSCTIQVSFRPTSSGIKTGTLSIADNAAGSPHTVTLRGGTLTAATARLISSTGAGLPGGNVSYREASGAWTALGSTGPDGSAQIQVPAGVQTLRMEYAGRYMEKTQDVANPVDFRTTRVTLQFSAAVDYLDISGNWRAYTKPAMELLPAADYNFRFASAASAVIPVGTAEVRKSIAALRLLDSTNAPIPAATVQYYVSGWRAAPNTDTNGWSLAVIDGLAGSTNFGMNYANTRQERNQNIAADSLVNFQTAGVIVRLSDSAGNPLDTGTATYYNGGWYSFGSTTSGHVHKELFPGAYRFSIAYANTKQEITQEVAAGAVVSFQTTAVQVQLRDSAGNPLDTGTATFYNGGWYPVGATSAGVARKELFAGTYNFSIAYSNTTQQKSQDVAANPIVVFQTIGVQVQLRDSTGNPLDMGTATYYSGGTYQIGATSGGQVRKELLPGTYAFTMAYANTTRQVSQDIAANPVVVFQTTSVQVQLRDSLGNPLDTGTATYYSGGTYPIGVTTGGQVRKELFPGTYNFSMAYANTTKQKSQNVATDPIVIFQTISAQVQLRDSAGNPLDTGIATFYNGGWYAIGATIGGQARKELFPGTYNFSMAYSNTTKQKSQDIAANPVVVFQTTSVQIQLRDSAGNPLDTGTAMFYNGGWYPVGTTAGGQVSKELFPGAYNFSMAYASATQQKTQDVAVNPVVIFQTGKVTSATGTAKAYYTTGWYTFTQNMELLPIAYNFQFTDGTANTLYTVTAAAQTTIH